MLDDTVLGVLACIFVAVAFAAGWEVAHSTVGKECDRLGAFYVGKNVYECRPKESTDAR